MCGQKSIEDTLSSELAVFEEEISKAKDSVYGTLIAHLYIEHLLDRYLKTKIRGDSGLFGKNGLSFSNKVKLAKGLGEFDDQLIDSIRKLNKIRNNCAHMFGHQISEEEVAEFGRTFGSKYRRIKDKYPNAEVGAIAPLVWNLCGQVLHITLASETHDA